MKSSRNGRKNFSGVVDWLASDTKYPAPIVAAIITSVSQCVTRAPPSLSDSQPPTGRINAPTPAPIQMNLAEIGEPSGATRMTPKTSSISFGNALAYPMNEPKVIV